jgi:GxxExxY protein
MHQNEITGLIVRIAFDIHSQLGPGLLESVYEQILLYELQTCGLQVSRQVGLPVIWKEVRLDLGFRPDLIVEGKVIVELKSVEALAPVHAKQVLTYLKLTGYKVGLLINFNEALLKNGIRRLVNNL